MAGDTVLIQEAIGEKVGKFQQLVSTFLGGFVVAFIRGWKLTLVMLAVLPALVLATTIMAKLLSRLSSEGQRCYAEAGNTVQQVVSSIRTVSVHKTNNHQHT
jgi:ATP-binding cassette subfamily B (MDR/TAP) protein 1